MNTSAEHGEPPKVSVVMPCFNAADYLPATLKSLAAQRFTDYELILVDDASTDTSLEILRR